jgi:tRNA (guanine-N7-)-methyltransferase
MSDATAGAEEDAPAAAEPSDAHPVAANKRYHGAKLMMEDSVFAELSLAEASQKVQGVRVRQHVNPLKASLQTQAPAPEWREVFADVAKPLVVDIGCGGGRFDLMFAKRHPELNVLGVDIRAPLVDRGNAWGEVAGIVDNVHFAECNATVSIGVWLKSYAALGEASRVDAVTIQFPDPHFKKRHHKRRVVQAALVRAVAQGLEPGARVFLQSDVRDVAEDMRAKFETFGAHLFRLDESLHGNAEAPETLAAANRERAREAAAAAFEEDERARVSRERAEANGYPGRVFAGDAVRPAEAAADSAADSEGTAPPAPPDPDAEAEAETEWVSAWAQAGDREGWLDENPLGVPTERECQTVDSGGRCYRVMLVRNDVAA